MKIIDLFYDAQWRIIKWVKNSEENVKKRKIRYGVAISVVKSLVSISLVVVANLVAKKIRGKAVI